MGNEVSEVLRVVLLVACLTLLDVLMYVRAGFNMNCTIRTCYLWNRRSSVEFLFTPGLLRSKLQSTEV